MFKNQSQIINCPYCGQAINRGAIKCKWCKRTIKKRKYLLIKRILKKISDIFKILQP